MISNIVVPGQYAFIKLNKWFMAIPVQFEDYFNIVTKNVQRMDGYLTPD